MAIKNKKNIRKQSNRAFLSKDFDTFKIELLRHAKTFFPEKIQDFSEPSVGGLLLDMASLVGDSLSFYLDHSFREMDPTRAVEPQNILTHLENAGMKVEGASPSSVDISVTITVPAEIKDGEYFPKLSALPVILEGTIFSSLSGVNFVLTKDLDYTAKTPSGNFASSYSIRSITEAGVPTEFDVTLRALAVSGAESIETFAFGIHEPFTAITLSNSNISSILSVYDTEGEDYYEVESLSQDNVFVAVENRSVDFDLVSHNLELLPAPRRFITSISPTTRLTTIQFGSGDADIFDDDILPDPSDVSLELYGKKTFGRFTIDPNALLKTQTLGIAPSNTTLTVRYRHGGGLDNNVPAGSIEDVDTLRIDFRNSPSADDALSVRESVSSNNELSAKGGAAAPDIELLRNRIVSARNSQMRTVTREDLLARIYTLPSMFGRVFRVSVEPNPSNPLASLMYVCSLDIDGNISLAPDSLKINLSRYLNEYRLISDAVDILDASVINFAVKYEVVIKRNIDRVQVIKSINAILGSVLNRKFFQIGQPILMDDIVNIIINFKDVISLASLRVYPRTGVIEDRGYSGFSFPFEESTKMGILTPPLGAIFELKFPGFDISGTAL